MLALLKGQLGQCVRLHLVFSLHIFTRGYKPS
jgi:hypothetical protein